MFYKELLTFESFSLGLGPTDGRHWTTTDGGQWTTTSWWWRALDEWPTWGIPC